MTLRLRLVLALVVLVTAGLGLFGVTTYSLYAHSQYQRLDTQLRSSEPQIHSVLDFAAGIGGRNRGDGFGAGNGPPGGASGPADAPTFIPPTAWAELIDRSGTVLSHITPGTTGPDLPHELPTASPAGKFFSVGSSGGHGGYRVMVISDGADNAYTTVVAFPASEATNALHRLVLIELFGALALLVILSAGSWLVLRSGLRPLERMAVTARSITSGNLSQRVSPSGGASEVGQLGLALNTMLGDIEEAFREREATELKLRQFLADASHELRTPLTSIQGFAELFRVSGEDARVDLPTILRRIEEESARMKVLVEDLLLLARLDETRPAERNPVDLAVLAADACSDAVATEGTRAITLDAPEPVVVAGDEDHLRQAIANLVTNAVRHTAPGAPIEVSARLVDGAATVAVRDHGPGLDAAALAHVFDRFWRADSARVGAGAGLGLAIVASIAAEHGGTASARNADDGGAVFTVTLPLSARQPATSAP